MKDQLLATLALHANVHGLAVASEATLLKELSVPREVMIRALVGLEADGSVTVLAPLPFLVCKLRKWTGEGERSRETAPIDGPFVDRAYSYQSSLSQERLKDSYRQPEGELMQELLTALGESDPTSFEGALRSYSPSVIRAALERIRRMKHIRKNPTAVFRFLLPRLAKEHQRTSAVTPQSL
ncbi:MAG: hypothetical protein ABIU54_06275 [Candidatus Eisenbacteria bacterium]